MIQRRYYRLLEMIPGLLVWTTFGAAIALSLFRPIWAIYFIIAFDFYWLLRVSYLLIYMISSWRRYRMTLRTHWLGKLKTLTTSWHDYLHVVFLPVYNEPYEVLHATFRSLMASDFPHRRIMIVLSGEERGNVKQFLENAKRLEHKYGQYFFSFQTIVHPKDIPGDLPGKGSNLNYAGHKTKEFLDSLNIDYSKVIVSAFDIDTQPHPQYFSYLTYRYATHPNPTRVSFQPIAMYNNNLWESNPIVRVVASSTTFWLLTDIARPERLFTFSSHSMSFQALVDAGFWDRTIVTEDSRIFLQCLVRYGGDYRVEPLYLPVFMNTVDIGHFWTSLKNQYRQMRRWAWGVEHFPWMMNEFFAGPRRHEIALIKKIRYTWNQLEGVYSWATAPIVMFLVGRLPILVSNLQNERAALINNVPYVLSTLMKISMIGVIVICWMYFFIIPTKPREKHLAHYIVILLQWIMVPFTLIIFGAIPAVDAQTRLMLGGRFRLGFWVTDKKVRTQHFRLRDLLFTQTELSNDEAT